MSSLINISYKDVDRLILLKLVELLLLLIVKAGLDTLKRKYVL